MEWNLSEYTEEFYKWCEQEKFEISEEDKTQLQPMIEQACEQQIATIDLFEIVKSCAS